MLRMHTVKGNKGNVRCTICAYSCPTIEELRSHQELIHVAAPASAEGTGGGGQPGQGETTSNNETKVAFHACSHCSKKFRSQAQREAHLRLIAQKQVWKDLKSRRIT
jgi:hypothetical protein